MARLVATNSGGLWRALCRTSDPSAFVTLVSGVTADIVQDNLARIRDPLSIRTSRNLRKLGEWDHIVWRNQEWRDSFKSYYGAPIRIHPGGEVIGILKVENMGCAKDTPIEAIDVLLNTRLSRLLSPEGDQGLTVFESQVLALRRGERATGLPDEIRGISLLALAYITADLAHLRDGEQSLKQAILVTYPRSPAARAVRGGHRAGCHPSHGR
jgi:hypothetical protein